MATCNFCGGPAKEIQRCPNCDPPGTHAAPVPGESEEARIERRRGEVAAEFGVDRAAVHHLGRVEHAALPVLTEEERGWIEAATGLKDRITADSHMMHAAYLAQLLRIIRRLTGGSEGGSRG